MESGCVGKCKSCWEWKREGEMSDRRGEAGCVVSAVSERECDTVGAQFS